MLLRVALSYWAHTLSLYHVCLIQIASGHVITPAPQQTHHVRDNEHRLRRQVSTCAGHAGYAACPIEQGGGCCPQGLICGQNQACYPPSTTSTTTRVYCDQDWFACPSSFGGGCCPGGGQCGPGECTLFETFTTNTLLSSSGQQESRVITTITSSSLLNQLSPSLISTLSVVVSGTETGSRVPTTTVVSTGGNGLTGGQIGGISTGAVVGFLLLVAFGWFIVRHLVRISRFMDNFDSSRKSTTKEEGGNTRDSEVTRLDSGNVGDGQPFTELSPQERPQLLDEWGRHGSRGPELTGSYEAHGVSELDSASVART